MNKNDKFKLYGYKKGFEQVSLDNKINEIYHLLYNSNLTNNIMEEKYPYDLVYLKNDAEAFFKNNNISLHTIPALNLFRFQQANLEENPSIDFTNLTDYINPLNLTTKYTNRDAFSGEVCKLLINNNKPNIILLYIKLGRAFSQILVPAYIHEITHTQVDTIIGSVENYHNAELLPIFMEKLVALQTKNKEFLNDIERLRFAYTLECMASLMVDKNISEEEALENSMYIVSSLQAQNLFNTYLEGNDNIKQEIIGNIQTVFDGSKTLETILKEMDINFENSLDTKIIEKRLIK